MPHVVAKKFKTVNRVMEVGAPVEAGDHLEPHDFHIMKTRGFIAEASGRGDPMLTAAAAPVAASLPAKAPAPPVAGDA